MIDLSDRAREGLESKGGLTKAPEAAAMAISASGEGGKQKRRIWFGFH